MICYKDITFCPYWEDCEKQIDCPRCLTKNIKSEAKRLRLNICQFTEKPECFKPTSKDYQHQKINNYYT